MQNLSYAIALKNIWKAYRSDGGRIKHVLTAIDDV